MSARPPRSRPAPAAGALLATLASFGLLLWGGATAHVAAPQAGTSTAAGRVQPVDDRLCEDCHPAVTRTWRETGMANALEPLRPGELAGLEPVHEEATGLVYTFEGDPDGEGHGARLVETGASEEPDAPGPSWRAAWPLDFAVGAGRLDRSYALRADDRWWFAPLEVVSAHRGSGEELERHAALAPPHAMAPGSRTSLPITPECLACHTDRPPQTTWPLNRVDPEWVPRGISCGACHARAEAHADWQLRTRSGEAPAQADPLLRHGDFDRVQRLSVCAACHLQGDARLELVPRAFAIPEPGGDLLQQRAAYVASESTSEVGFVSHVERLVLSACYLQTGAAAGDVGGGVGLTCETCHDPHRSLAQEEERLRVRAACAGCHPGPDSSAPGEHGGSAAACALEAELRPAGRDCASCHLPETPVFDVAGVRIHDHWIRRRPVVAEVAEALRFEESPTGDWRRFEWPDAEPPAHLEDAGLHLMAFVARGRAEQAAAIVDERPGGAAVRLPMYHHVRGTVLESLGRPQEAERALRVALALDPRLVPARVNLGLLLVNSGRAAEGEKLLTETLELAPAADTALRNRALARAAQGDSAGFVRDLEEAYRLRPVPEVAEALAAHFEREGEPGRAARWRRLAAGLEPPGLR